MRLTPCARVPAWNRMLTHGGWQGDEFRVTGIKPPAVRLRFRRLVAPAFTDGGSLSRKERS
jgi:hypothetical protein